MTPAAGVLFVDVDGTLVGSHGVADRVWPALSAARDAGWRVAICTGRPGRGHAMDYAIRADPDGLHVFESGAVVLKTDGTVVHAIPVAEATIDNAIAIGRRHGVTLEAYAADGRYFAAERNGLIAGHEALLGFDATIGPMPPDAAVVRVQWVVPDADWPALEPLARQLAGVSLHVGRSPRMPGVNFVALTAAGTSKATGAQVVLDRFGVDADSAAMVGDQLNDIPLLSLVGRAMVVGDGHEEAKRIATAIVGSADEGGVADAVAQLLRG